MMNKIKKSKAGITLVEVVLSSAILLIFISSISAVYVSFIKTSIAGSLDLKAYYILEEGVEAVKSIRDESWTNNIATLSTNTSYQLYWTGTKWQATTTNQYVDGILREFTIVPAYRDIHDDLAVSGTLDPNTKHLLVSVSWHSQTGTSTRSTETYITNIFSN